MTGYLVRRVLELVPTALVIIAASFALVRLAPGSPFSSEKEISPEIRRQLEAKYGFDRPLPEQFVRYVGNLLQAQSHWVSIDSPRIEHPLSRFDSVWLP